MDESRRNTQEILSDPPRARSGDAGIKLSIFDCDLTAELVFRAIRFDRIGEFAQNLSLQGNNTDRLDAVQFEEVVASDGSNREVTNRPNKYHKKGILFSRKKYFVYRFLLYNDGFTPFSSKRGSMDGCYIIRLDVPPGKRTPSNCIRRLWLTPPIFGQKKVFNRLHES